MRKIVINTCHGGFCLSEEARFEYARLHNLDPTVVYSWKIPRDDEILVSIVEKMGEFS